jgi:hypothetical protein
MFACAAVCMAITPLRLGCKSVGVIIAARHSAAVLRALPLASCRRGSACASRNMRQVLGEVGSAAHPPSCQQLRVSQAEQSTRLRGACVARVVTDRKRAVADIAGECVHNVGVAPWLKPFMLVHCLQAARPRPHVPAQLLKPSTTRQQLGVRIPAGGRVASESLSTGGHWASQCRADPMGIVMYGVAHFFISAHDVVLTAACLASSLRSSSSFVSSIRH